MQIMILIDKKNEELANLLVETGIGKEIGNESVGGVWLVLLYPSH